MRDTLILLAIVFAFGVSFAMLSRVIGLDSPWLILLLMFYFLGVAKTAEPLFRMKIPQSLYPLRTWELRGDLGRRLGIFGFGRVLRKSPLRHLNAGVYFDPADKEPARLLRQIESSEAIHFWAAILFVPYMGYAAITEKWAVLTAFVLAQLLVNVYPILHLRHTRRRLARTLESIKMRSR